MSDKKRKTHNKSKLNNDIKNPNLNNDENNANKTKSTEEKNLNPILSTCGIGRFRSISPQQEKQEQSITTTTTTATPFLESLHIELPSSSFSLNIGKKKHHQSKLLKQQKEKDKKHHNHNRHQIYGIEEVDSEKKQKQTIIKMAGDSNSVVSLYKELKNEWNKKNCNLQKCGIYLDKLKIELTKLSYLPTAGISVPKQDLIIARDVLEIAVEYSVAKKDIPAFERYISQLKCYYYDYRQIIGESEKMYKLLGLNLLYLLSVNRVSEFHTELELLSTEVIQRNQYIRPILALEQYIMEGRYNKIFQARGSLPADLYNFFMDILVETVRDEIGACLEKSYEKISLQEAAKRLNLKSKEEVKVFGEKRNWNLGPDGVYYFITKAAKPKEALPSIELAEQAIFYARELEMIV